jgi:hypothetical protein
MSRIAFLAGSSHPARRRSQRDPREFFNSLLERPSECVTNPASKGQHK